MLFNPHFENSWFPDEIIGFLTISAGKDINYFAKILLMLEAKFGDDLLFEFIFASGWLIACITKTYSIYNVIETIDNFFKYS